jgi:hypothetical protein
MPHDTLHPSVHKSQIKLIFFEFSRVFGTASGIAIAARMRTDVCRLATLDNQVSIADGPTFKVALKNLTGNNCIR